MSSGKSYFAVLSIIAIAVVLFYGCGKDDPVKGNGGDPIKLSETEKTVYQHENFSLTCESGGREVSWSSTDLSVATVNNGTVRTYSEGRATITATCGDVSATCEVTVRSPYDSYELYLPYIGDGLRSEPAIADVGYYEQGFGDTVHVDHSAQGVGVLIEKPRRICVRLRAQGSGDNIIELLLVTSCLYADSFYNADNAAFMKSGFKYGVYDTYRGAYEVRTRRDKMDHHVVQPGVLNPISRVRGTIDSSMLAHQMGMDSTMSLFMQKGYWELIGRYIEASPLADEDEDGNILGVYNRLAQDSAYATVMERNSKGVYDYQPNSNIGIIEEGSTFTLTRLNNDSMIVSDYNFKIRYLSIDRSQILPGFELGSEGKTVNSDYLLTRTFVYTKTSSASHSSKRESPVCELIPRHVFTKGNR